MERIETAITYTVAISVVLICIARVVANLFGYL